MSPVRFMYLFILSRSNAWRRLPCCGSKKYISPAPIAAQNSPRMRVASFGGAVVCPGRGTATCVPVGGSGAGELWLEHHLRARCEAESLSGVAVGDGNFDVAGAAGDGEDVAGLAGGVGGDKWEAAAGDFHGCRGCRRGRMRQVGDAVSVVVDVDDLADEGVRSALRLRERITGQRRHRRAERLEGNAISEVGGGGGHHVATV